MHPRDNGLGYSVALEGNLAAVGTFGESVNVFSFDNSGQYQTIARLVASDHDPNESFGYAVGIAGSDILVGNPSDSDGGRIAGATYIFRVPEPASAIFAVIAILAASLCTVRNDRQCIS